METGAGAVIVDTGSTAAMGAEIRAFAEQHLGGVAAVLNSHNHPDHWFGNAAFEDRPTLALPQTQALCARNAPDYAESLYAILGAWMTGTKAVPPAQPLTAGTMEFGGRALRLLPLAGHTPADLVLIDERTGTLIAADLLFLDRAPSFPDADAATWLAALDVLERLDISGTLPGHGPFHRSNAALVQTRAFLRATDARLRQAAEAGLSPVEAMAAGPVPEFATLGANPEEYIRTVAQRWGDYEIEALPVIGGA
ncbi:MBL fold metallo-hydrolase [Paenirhodobacter sp.]|uniref:MBL fold metallo-hydrolase n=1 Tax=Paenirhodobacter sp. TaxID=1965326 RepID=UPI003B3F3833